MAKLVEKEQWDIKVGAIRVLYDASKREKYLKSIAAASPAPSVGKVRGFTKC